MRERVGILFSGDWKAFVTAWNAQSEHKINLGIVQFYAGDPDYERVKELFSKFSKQYNMGWAEWTDLIYTSKDLLTFELLKLVVLGRAGEGNNALAPVYSIEPLCSVCGKLKYTQVHDLVLDRSEVEEDPEEFGYFRHDFCETDFGEVVVSGRVKAVLDEHQVPGITLRPTEPLPGRRGRRKAYFQLLVEAEIGPMVAPSPIIRLDLCEACGQYKQVLRTAFPGRKGSEYYFPRDTHAGAWAVRTYDRFGRLPKFKGDILISQQLYRLFKANKLTGFRVQPAHLVD